MATLADTEKLSASLSGMLSQAAPHVWLDPKLGLVVGSFPKAEFKFDFAEERFVRLEEDTDVAPLPPTGKKKLVSLLQKAARVRTIYRIETPFEIYKVGSATQMLVEGLNIVERMRPGTLSKLAQEKGRTKRPVALRREDLYDYPHPPEHSAQLESGFFAATNNKAHEARGFLMRAIGLAGLEQDVVLHTD